MKPFDTDDQYNKWVSCSRLNHLNLLKISTSLALKTLMPFRNLNFSTQKTLHVRINSNQLLGASCPCLMWVNRITCISFVRWQDKTTYPVCTYCSGMWWTHGNDGNDGDNGISIIALIGIAYIQKHEKSSEKKRRALFRKIREYSYISKLDRTCYWNGLGDGERVDNTTYDMLIFVIFIKFY